jgi:very-short-patch-repair endonuclease
MTLDRARSLRRSSTEAEKALWEQLRNRRLAGVKFRRQVPLGSYIVDFLSERPKLIVEVDDGQHAEQVAYDTARTEWLEARGFKAIRFWNEEVIGAMDEVLKLIETALAER